MTLKELIEQYSYKNEGLYTLIDIEKLCKEYAKICLEKAAAEARLCFAGPDCEIEDTDETGCSNDYGSYWINRRSITNIELP